MTVKTGLEVLRESGFELLAGKRVGLMSHPGAVDRTLTSVYRIFSEAPQVNLRALFGPEHGFAGQAADGVIIDSTHDTRTGLPVYTLYGENFRPTAEMLRELDVLVCDIQDIGVRYYTFTWTMTHILEAAGEADVEVVILDRPNPLGAKTAGPLLQPAYASLMGRFPLPICHGMTVGEIAQMSNLEWNPTPAKLAVVRCKGWSRAMCWPQTGLAWVPTSPNMPHWLTVQHYPGACLIEGANLSEGRGTTLPFEIVGAPFIDGEWLADHLNAKNWPGVRFRPLNFTPAASKWAGESCGGVQAHLVDEAVYDPLRVWLGALIEIRRRWPEDFHWLPPYLQHPHFDLLMGGADARQKIDAGADLSDIMQGWEEACAQFIEARRPHLIYPESKDTLA